jgi:hypothetical protein
MNIESIQELTDSVISFVNKHQEQDEIPCVVIVDSLSSLVHQYGFMETMEFLEHMHQILFNHATSIDSIIGIIHMDAHVGKGGLYDDEVNSLKLRAQGIIEVQDVNSLDRSRRYFFSEGNNVEEKILDKKQIHFKCDLMSMRSKSKLLSHEEFYKVLSEKDCIISHVKHPFIPKKKNKQVAEQEKKIDTVVDANVQTTARNIIGSRIKLTDHPQDKKDIQRQLPFKVDLSKKEQEDREKVVLPYVTEGLALNKGNGLHGQEQKKNKGFIIVDSDSDNDDEYDSEDPDADLDI